MIWDSVVQSRDGDASLFRFLLVCLVCLFVLLVFVLFVCFFVVQSQRCSYDVLMLITVLDRSVP